MSLPSLTIPALTEAYRAGAWSPVKLVSAIFEASAERGDDHVWIGPLPKARALAWAAELEKEGPSATRPLWGIPFAVKDNIDVAGCETTSACPGFAYKPEKDAHVVARLIEAGAICIGKTNLDQFATGLVGVRSPYGVARNPFNGEYIPGGSSSGSAVAVASGLVSFALGTDTAGSGRVPAGINNIVGLKPTVGLLSATGMVAACRSLDCISIFALTVPDAMRVLGAAQDFDERDAYSRRVPAGWAAQAGPKPGAFRFALPDKAGLNFFGDREAEAQFGRAVQRMKELGGEAIEINYAPFAEAQGMLYSPPGAAERTTALYDFLSKQPDAIHPVTRGILESGLASKATDLYRMQQRIKALKQQTDAIWKEVDFLLVPTAGTVYRIKEIEAEPLKLNANLGYYTNFVNYFDLSALAVPQAMRGDGLPCGVTLIAPAFHEAKLAAFGAAFHQASGLPLGATKAALPTEPPANAPAFPALPVAVFGAHMRGEALNHELLGLGGRFAAACATAPDYKLYRIGALPKARPGLVRVTEGGAAIEGEIWELPPAAFGAFVAGIPAPLGIGSVSLSDGRTIKGFLCEAAAALGAEEITAFGGWRAYLKARAV